MSINVGRYWMLLVLTVAVVGVLAVAIRVHAIRQEHQLPVAKQAELTGEHCDTGISAAKAHVVPAASMSMPTAGDDSRSAWTPQLNPAKAPGPAPAGMVWVRGGQFWMGTDDEHMPDTKPWHRVYVSGFWMDKSEVTNAQFAKFVKATGYVTVAERKPRAEDFPGAPPENLVAGSVVFTPPDHPVELNNHYQWWNYIAGANWQHPEGPKSGIQNRMNHPVVQVAYEDAVAYAKWAGKRLPTEAEFEFASRGGLDRKRYDWGDEFRPGGKYMANTFQGNFPEKNTAADGYSGTSPVGSFPANGYGLVDMSGNVWEWTSDWYRADYYQTLAATGEIAMNPKGPADSLDPSEPGVPKRVHRG